MRLVWSLVAALGLLVAVGLAAGRLGPPEEVTRPATSHEAILTGGTAQPVLASEPAPLTPMRLPPATPAHRAPSVHLSQPDIPSGSVLAQPTASVVNATRTSPPGVAREVQVAEPSTAQARDEAPPAPAAVADDARLAGARPMPAVTGGARYDVARPRPTRPKVDAPRVSAPTPTPCVLEPPPRHLDAALRAPEK